MEKQVFKWQLLLPTWPVTITTTVKWAERREGDQADAQTPLKLLIEVPNLDLWSLLLYPFSCQFHQQQEVGHPREDIRGFAELRKLYQQIINSSHVFMTSLNCSLSCVFSCLADANLFFSQELTLHCLHSHFFIFHPILHWHTMFLTPSHFPGSVVFSLSLTFHLHSFNHPSRERETTFPLLLLSLQSYIFFFEALVWNVFALFMWFPLHPHSWLSSLFPLSLDSILAFLPFTVVTSLRLFLSIILSRFYFVTHLETDFILHKGSEKLKTKNSFTVFLCYFKLCKLQRI